MASSSAVYADHVQEVHPDIWDGYVRAVISNPAAVAEFSGTISSALYSLGQARMAPEYVAALLRAFSLFAIIGMEQICDCGIVVPIPTDEPSDEEGLHGPGGSFGGNDG